MLIADFAARKVLDVVRSHRRMLDDGRRAGFLRRKLFRLRHEFWGVLSGTDIALGARIGAGLRLPHSFGVIIHPNSEIGDNCMIMQHATIGMLGTTTVPRIGSDVYIGAGARILGDVTVGDGARIGANAVVLTDVPPHCTVVGIPARVVRRRSVD